MKRYLYGIMIPLWNLRGAGLAEAVQVALKAGRGRTSNNGIEDTVIALLDAIVILSLIQAGPPSVSA